MGAGAQVPRWASLVDRLNPARSSFDPEFKARWDSMGKKQRKKLMAQASAGHSSCPNACNTWFQCTRREEGGMRNRTAAHSTAPAACEYTPHSTSSARDHWPCR